VYESRATRPVWAGRLLGAVRLGGGRRPKFNFPKLVWKITKSGTLRPSIKGTRPGKAAALTQEIARLLEEKKAAGEGLTPS